MDNFKAVYKILSTLDKAMDLPEFDMSAIIDNKKEYNIIITLVESIYES